jgi:hypothetical protein
LEPDAIRSFLGADICESPVVRNNRLTAEEAVNFDSPLSLNELDMAINQLNEKSVGGLDGIGTKFLKKFWPYIRIPLHRCVSCCIQKQTLSQSFNSVIIRLIPKKGDVEKIKNWRPISLLNCVFKIVSKAVDNRLKKINDIVLSRAQKGFTNKRFIQECFINVSESVAYSEYLRVPGFVLALDMAKAFDTVKHDFKRMNFLELVLI